MNRKGIFWISLSWALVALMCLATTGCSQDRQSNYQHDVEIAPNRWLTLKEERGKCWFICEWNGKKVTWDGKRDGSGENELPVTLRECDGELFMIVFNREDTSKCKYVFFKLASTGTRFVEIPPVDFPKQIATENMTFSENTRKVGINEERIDSWEVIRKLDIESPYFTRSQTCKIWVGLELGLSYEEVSKTVNDEKRQRIAREYVVKYKPIPLPTIVKE